MFSKRFNWNAEIHPLSVRLRDKVAAGREVIDLTDANPTRAGLDYPVHVILAALTRPEAMVYKPAPRGLRVAREAVSHYYRDLGETIIADDILLTAGTSEAYGLLFKVLADPGDEILIPRPGYPLLSHLAGFEGLACHSYPLRYHAGRGWCIDLDVLEALVTVKTRAVVVVNPNNPTGNYIKDIELAAIDALCRRHDMALIVDEVFADFEDHPAPYRIRTTLNRTTALTFILNGFSKTLGLPQLKLGWIAISGNREQVISARANLETLVDFYLCVSAPVQVGASQMLSRRADIQRQINARINGNFRFLKARVQPTRNLQVLIREGGWYGVLAIDDSVADDQRALELLERDNTLIHPGFFYDFFREGFVVLSLLPEQGRFRMGIDRLIRRYGEVAVGAHCMDSNA
jgi:alanine-synthesizing transaminase